MSDASSLVAIATISGIPSILTAVGVFYGIFKNNQREDRAHVQMMAVAGKVETARTDAIEAARVLALKTAQTQMATGEKLGEIHKLVNSQLTEAINRLAVEKERSRAMLALLHVIAPDNPAVLAFAVPSEKEGQP